MQLEYMKGTSPAVMSQSHPGSASMTGHLAAVPDVEMDARWRDWQARGAERDRRTATIMGRVSLLIAMVLAIWLFVRLL